MAIPKVVAPCSYPVSAFLEATVDIASIAAVTTLVVEVSAPRAFRYGRPVLVMLKLGQTDLEANVLLSDGQVVLSTTKKIRFRIINPTAGAIDPASKVFWFLQL